MKIIKNRKDGGDEKIKKNRDDETMKMVKILENHNGDETD